MKTLQWCTAAASTASVSDMWRFGARTIAPFGWIRMGCAIYLPLEDLVRLSSALKLPNTQDVIVTFHPLPFDANHPSRWGMSLTFENNVDEKREVTIWNEGI